MAGIAEVIGGTLEEALGGIASPLGIAVFAGIMLVGGPRAKPLAKNALKGYLVTTKRVREWVAEATEQVQDLYAEARYEYESELGNEQVPEGETRRRGRTQPTEESA